MSDLDKTTYLPSEMAEEIRALKKYIGSGGGLTESNLDEVDFGEIDEDELAASLTNPGLTNPANYEEIAEAIKELNEWNQSPLKGYIDLRPHISSVGDDSLHTYSQGTFVSYYVRVLGRNVNYEWQVSFDDGETWGTVATNVLKYRFQATQAMDRAIVRCIGRNLYGEDAAYFSDIRIVSSD